MDTGIDKKLVSQNEILSGLKRNVRFYPKPGTPAFSKLPMEERAKAYDYFERDQERVDRLMAEYEAKQKLG